MHEPAAGRGAQVKHVADLVGKSPWKGGLEETVQVHATPHAFPGTGQTL